jgi:acyl-CoA thioester hydrolase
MDDTQHFNPAHYRYWGKDQVRFSDLDPVGHVNNNAIGQYFENARATLFIKVTPLWPQGDQFFVLGRTAIDFRRELHMPSPLLIGTSIARIGRTSITVNNALFRGEEARSENGIAYCESISVWIDRVTRKPVEIPASLREIMKPYISG